MIGGSSALRKEVDDRVGQARELAERFNHRLTLGVANLAERYRRGECQLDILVRVENDYLLLRLELVSRRQDGEFPHMASASSWLGSDLELLSICGDSHQIAVFALIVEPMKGVQEVVPSTVRLQRLDDLSIFFGESSQFSLRPRVGKASFGVGDNKVSIRSFYGPVLFRESMSEMIKAVSLCLDDHSYARFNSVRDIFEKDDFEEATLCQDIRLSVGGRPFKMRLRLLPEAVGLAFDEESDLDIEDLDLRVRPI